jgi:hypothetical protein
MEKGPRPYFHLPIFIPKMNSSSRYETLQKLLKYLEPTYSLSSPISPLLPLVWSYIEVSERLDSLEEWASEKKDDLRRINHNLQQINLGGGHIRSGSEPNPKSISSKRTRRLSVVMEPILSETLSYYPRRRSSSAKAAETY